MTYDRLREWFDSFEGDPFTVAVIGALVDVAESARATFEGHDLTDPTLDQDMREAVQALEDLETALDDSETDFAIEAALEKPRLAS